ncbi:hypothetical protein ACVWWO_007591 [Bradyrhizobium sp. F1.13.1]
MRVDCPFGILGGCGLLQIAADLDPGQFNGALLVTLGQLQATASGATDALQSKVPQKEIERRHDECLRKHWKRLNGTAPFPLDQ